MCRELPFEKFAEVRRQCIVCRRCGKIQSVTARLGYIERQEDCRAHSITTDTVSFDKAECEVNPIDSHLIAHITVPLDATDVVLDLIIDGACTIKLSAT